jgi:hypothetical protein
VVQEREIAKILAVMLDQVQHRGGSSGVSTDNFSNRDRPSGPHDCLAVNREALGLDQLGGTRARRQSHGPVIRAAGKALLRAVIS